MQRRVLVMGLALGASAMAWGMESALALKKSPSVSVTPRFAEPFDEVFVTVTGWKATPYIGIERVEIRREANNVWLGLYWHHRPAGPGEQRMAVEFLPATYEHTESLGTFGPGSYRLYVQNHGAVDGSGSTRFAVRRETTRLVPGEDAGPTAWPSIRDRGGMDPPPEMTLDGCLCHRYPELFEGNCAVLSVAAASSPPHCGPPSSCPTHPPGTPAR